LIASYEAVTPVKTGVQDIYDVSKYWITQKIAKRIEQRA
jgi:hypothetical protein